MSFATSTINQSATAITAIEAQITQLQEQLTALQEQQQAIKSAEQQGLSAISQYKQAIATIAQLDEPEMLQQFLEEMATITSQALGSPQLPDFSEGFDPEASPEPEPDTPLVENEIPLVEDEVPLVDEAPLVEDDGPVDVSESYADIKFTELKSYASQHNIKTHKMNKAKIATELHAAGHGPDKIQLWLKQRKIKA